MKSLASLSLIFLSASTYALPAAPGNFTVSLMQIKNPGVYLREASRAPGKQATIPVTPAGKHILLGVGVGNPVIMRSILFDTGSALTWIKQYVESSTSVQTGQIMHNEYGPDSHLAYFWGPEYKDTITLADNIVIEDQSVGSAVVTVRIETHDGVLGLGRTELSRGKLWPNTDALVPTVMDNLFAQGTIAKKVYSVFLQPSQSSSAQGSVTFGGIDENLYVGPLSYVPLTSKFPSVNYWGFDIGSLTYNGQTIIPAGSPGIVDTGSPMIFLAGEYFDVYKQALIGAWFEPQGLMVVPRKARANMKPLQFNIGGTVFTLDKEDQLIPREQNEEWGGQKRRRRYSWIGSSGAPKGNGFDFILGLPFLRKFYTVYDGTKDAEQIGFAIANWNVGGLRRDKQSL